MLTRSGHQITVAKNGSEAIDLAQSSRPEVILMDIFMPVMGGLNATRHLRAMPEFANLPIIALTGNADAESIVKCGEAGCTMHLAKPVSMPKR